MDMTYQLGGYYVMRLHQYPFAPAPRHAFYTICPDFNENLLDFRYRDDPARSGTEHSMTKVAWRPSPQELEKIRAWVEQKQLAGHLLAGNVFSDLETAYEYRNYFFGQVPDTVILGISFLSTEVQRTLLALKNQLFRDIWPFPTCAAQAGPLWENFSRPIVPPAHRQGRQVGYDIIGLELGVILTDSFLVHGWNLFRPFGVALNDYGLIPDDSQQAALMDFMQDPDSPVEPDSWFWAQVTLFD